MGRKASFKGAAENGGGLVGLPAPRVSEQVCTSRPQESELLRAKAFLLFGKLANVVRVSKRHFFKEEVKKAWVPLMLHCQDPCSEAAQVRRTLVFASPSLGPAVPKRNVFSGSAGSEACGLPHQCPPRSHAGLGKGTSQDGPTHRLTGEPQLVLGAEFPSALVTNHPVFYQSHFKVQ